MAIEVPSSLVQPPSNGEAGESDGHRDAPAASENVASRASSAYPRAMNSRYLPIIGLFVFYVAHDALQERMFRFDGFEFGFFMTLAEVLVMLVGSAIGGDGVSRARGGGGRGTLPSAVLIRIGWVGLFLALAHGLGNTSLNYSPYPLKVAFKSCKLVPTMAMGACVTGRKHTALQYAAALVMGAGLACLTAADVFNFRRKATPGLAEDSEWSEELGPFIGPILLTISTIFDSIVPNLQEQLLQTAKVKTSEMILVSNMVMCVVVVGYTTYSGELVTAWKYCVTHRDALGVLLAQGLSAYLGLKCYLSIIRDYGGVVGVLVANARKIVTIFLSFCLFAKPFNERHVVGLVLVFVGVYLGYLSKNGKKSAPKKDGKSSSSDRKRSKQKKSGGGQSHDHNV